MQVLDSASGSVYYEQGNTKVLASVYGPHEVGSLESCFIHVVKRLAGPRSKPSFSRQRADKMRVRFRPFQYE